MLIDFFVVGVQKGGTTALDYFLRQHPSIQMAKVKEVHFFDDETVDWQAFDTGRLHAAFTWDQKDMIRGEATPIYIYWPSALERLQRYNPSAKLIVGIRHPSFRAFSHWRMEAKRDAESMPFALAISPEARRRVSEAPAGVHRVFSYVERGFYAPQLRRLLNLFDRRQLFVFRTDRLWERPHQVLSSVEEFLGVSSRIQPEKRYVAPMDNSDIGAFPDECRAQLNAIYEQDIRTTAHITGIDLSDWLDPHYRELMVAT